MTYLCLCYIHPTLQTKRFELRELKEKDENEFENAGYFRNERNSRSYQEIQVSTISNELIQFFSLLFRVKSSFRHRCERQIYIEADNSAVNRIAIPRIKKKKKVEIEN